MESRETRIRQRLGAEVARLRKRQGFPKQPDLAAAAGLGIRTVTAVENGQKVSRNTLRAIEATLSLEPGVIEAFLAEEIKDLPMPAPPSRVQRQADEWIVAASYPELGTEAARIEEAEGSVAAQLWMEGALKIRQDHLERPSIQSQSATDRDVS